MKSFRNILITFMLLGSLAFALPATVHAQTGSTGPALSVSTTYPNQVVELGESVTLSLKIEASEQDQIVQLSTADLPEGWTASFRGAGRIVNSVYVEGNDSEMVDLRLDPPQNPEAGEFSFRVIVQGNGVSAELPITLSVQEKVPGNLTFSIDLPTIQGSPTTNFKYSAKLENTGDEEVTINLTADAPAGFSTKFSVSGQEVNSFPLGANQSKSITVELSPISKVDAGDYTCLVYATGGDMQATLKLEAQVTGQEELSLSGPDGRLSGKATAGKDTALQLVVENTGTAPAQNVQLSASAPSGWTVSFDPEIIPEVKPGDQMDVNAVLTPADKAVAGDYMVTMKAKPVDGTQTSADFRIAVTTSTLWGFAGIALIAVAVGVVAIAVTRFGRR